MSIQDNIFDVRDALKDHDELFLFEELVDYIASLEKQNTELLNEVRPWRQIKTTIANEVLNSDSEIYKHESGKT